MKVVTPKEMSALDRQTIEGGVPSGELMERAGQECFKVIRKELPPHSKVLVICGTGNNGGDGQVIARLLKQNGFNVTVLFTAALERLKERMTPESAENYIKLEKMGIPLLYAAQGDLFGELLRGYDVIIDAVFGTGLDDRPMSEYYQALFEAINSNPAEIISVDIPSGLNGLNGNYHSAVKADMTIIIQAPKTGELLGNGPDLTGRTVVVDIGIDTDQPTKEFGENKKRLLQPQDIVFPKPRLRNSHKYHYGRILIVAGSRGMLGAAALAAGAALRSGAGLVTAYVAEELHTQLVSIMPPEALVTPYERILTYFQLEGVRRDCILFGPGLGRHNDYSGLLDDLMDQEAPIVVDADGLWMMHNNLNAFKGAKCPVIITPHHGEFAALLDITTEDLRKDPIHYASLFAQEYKVVVVLKGHRTLIVGPEGEIWFNLTGNPGMATPGSGDVLAGMTAAILGQLKDPMEAAKSAVYYHGLAGDYYAKKYGETTLVATDIIKSLKHVIN